MNTLWLAFLTGLTTGGLSCLAVQGGLLASAVSTKSGASLENDVSGKVSTWRAVGLFIIAKLTAYTILGFLLGLVGSLLVLSPKVLGVMQLAAGFFMLVTAARIANIHPIFRYFVIEPPRFIYRFMRKTSREQSVVAPAVLGFLTVLLPCGVTQATMVIAVASGSPFMGAAIMFAFVLGTSPVFFILGGAIVEFLKRKVFSLVAATIVGIFAILSINGGVGLLGSFYTLQNIYLAAVTPVSALSYAQHNLTGAQVANGVQDVTINVSSLGYAPSVSTLKVGIPVRLTLSSTNANGCVRAFTIPDYSISKVLPVTGQEVISFTPTKTGRLAFSCSMGMYTGAFNVVL